MHRKESQQPQRTAFLLRRCPRGLNRIAAVATGVAQAGAINLDRKFVTIPCAIGRLERNDIVQKTTDAKRNRVYCARALLEILEEPAHLTPEAVE